MGKRRVFAVKVAPTTGRLDIKVVDERGMPVEGAYVSRYPGGAGLESGVDGHAVFDEMPAGRFDVSAGKAGYGAVADGPEARASVRVDVAAGSSAERTLTLYRLPRILRENVVLVGSERFYESFKLKMMFVGPAVATVNRSIDLRPAERTTVLYVADGYTRFEKLALEQLATRPDVTLVPITTAAAIVAHFNTRPRGQQDGVATKTLLQDVVIFAHGFPGKFAFNLSKRFDAAIDFTEDDLEKIDAHVFVPDGCILSYACRTGCGVDAKVFPNDAAAKPEASLAQRMADHFGVDVFAYLTRTFYGDCLVAPADFDDLASALNDARDAAGGGVVDLPPDHEALPHAGLGEWRARLDGTKDYALWRKRGALAMPVGHDTPKGLSQHIRRFRRYE
jgi:hypothetical protein